MLQVLRHSVYKHWEFCLTGIAVLYVQTFLYYKLCVFNAFVD